MSRDEADEHIQQIARWRESGEEVVEDTGHIPLIDESVLEDSSDNEMEDSGVEAGRFPVRDEPYGVQGNIPRAEPTSAISALDLASSPMTGSQEPGSAQPMAVRSSPDHTGALDTASYASANEANMQRLRARAQQTPAQQTQTRRLRAHHLPFQRIQMQQLEA